jgi:hypothetical protein
MLGSVLVRAPESLTNFVTANILAEESTALDSPRHWLKLHCICGLGWGLAKSLVPNQTTRRVHNA